MSAKKYDIVYLYKASNTNGLRFSLRSLKNVPARNVIIVGDKPDWMTNVLHIPFAFGKSKVLNEWNQLLLACEVTENFLLFNDDFYVLNPLSSYHFYKGDMSRPNSEYFKAYKRTKSHFKSFKNFEVHSPMLFNSDGLKELKRAYNLKSGYLHRSLYGNHYEIEGEKTKDNKIYRMTGFEKKLEGDFVSTCNKIERHDLFKKKMLELFPEKSKYEANDIH